MSYISLNQLIGIALEDQLKQAEYKYEHGPSPQFLAENKWFYLKMFVTRTF